MTTARAAMGADEDALAARLARALARTADATSDYDLDAAPAVPDAPLRPAGVLLAFRPDGRLILTKRGQGLRHHPGQIALPGGKVDPADASPTAAALREAAEEIGLPAADVRLVGALPQHRTVTGFAITPVVGLIPQDFVPVPEAGEVDEVFEVPLHHVADPGRYRIEARQWRGVTRRYWVAPWGPWYIWGATARILRGLAERLA